MLKIINTVKNGDIYTLISPFFLVVLLIATDKYDFVALLLLMNSAFSFLYNLTENRKTNSVGKWRRKFKISTFIISLLFCVLLYLFNEFSNYVIFLFLFLFTCNAGYCVFIVSKLKTQ